jgi:RING finger protein 170
MEASLFSDFPIELAAYVTISFAIIVATVFLVVERLLPLFFGGNQARLPPATPDEVQALQQAAQQRRARRVENQNQDADCVICLGAFQTPVEMLNCGHLCCQDCLVALVDAPTFHGKCPICRCDIHFFAPAFHRMPENQTPEQTMANFADSLRRYNNRRNNNGEGNMNNNDFFGIFRYGFRNFNRLPTRMKSKIILYVVVALIYLISPFDLISEAVAGPVFGLIDDVVVLIVATAIIFLIIKRTLL